MRKHILASLVLIPFLMGFSDAAQNWSVDPSEHTMVFSSEDSGSNSYLGVDIADVTGERVSQLKLKEEKGVEITMVDQDAPAGKAGVKEHDVVLTMNGTPVDSAAQLRRMIHETPPGRVVTLGLSRDGQPMTVKVQLGDKGKEYSYTSSSKGYHVEIPPIPPIPPMPEMDFPSFNMVVVTSSPRSGLTVENITPQLAEFFGVKSGNGVLVRAVAKASRAEKAGFRAGDVIVKVNGESVHDTNDFTHAVRSREGNAVNVGVVRERKEQTISLPMPERKDSGRLLDEESVDYPLLGDAAPVAVDVQEAVHAKLAQLEPQIRLATENAAKYAEEIRKSAYDQSKEARHEAEQERSEALREAEQERNEARREAEQERSESLREAEQQRREALEEARQQRDEFRKEHQQLRDELRQMKKEIRRAWAEI